MYFFYYVIKKNLFLSRSLRGGWKKASSRLTLCGVPIIICETTRVLLISKTDSNPRVGRRRLPRCDTHFSAEHARTGCDKSVESAVEGISKLISPVPS